MSTNDERVAQVQLFASQVLEFIDRQEFWQIVRKEVIKSFIELMRSIVKASRSQKDLREVWGPRWQEVQEIQALLDEQPNNPAIETRLRELLTAIAPPPPATDSS